MSIKFTNIFIILILLCSNVFAKTVSIDVYNVFRLSIWIRVKCNYNNTTKKFDLDHTYYIPGNKSINISLPNHYTKCQVWPVNYKIF